MRATVPLNAVWICGGVRMDIIMNNCLVVVAQRSLLLAQSPAKQNANKLARNSA